MTAAFDSGNFRFEPVTAAYLPMLAEWLKRPHWREWWGDPDEELGFITDMVEGRDRSCRPFLFCVGGEPLGYIQAWDIGPHQTPEWTAGHPWLAALPADAVGVDMSIADEARLSTGVGSAALRAFVQALREMGHATIIIDPDPANGRAVAAYSKAGFRPAPALRGQTEDVLIMQFQQDATLA